MELYNHHVRISRMSAFMALMFVAGIASAANTNDVTVTWNTTNHLYLRLWLPDGAARIRGVIVTCHPSGNPGYTQDYRPSADYTSAWDETYTTDYDTRTKAADLALQLVAQRHAFALVGLCFQDQKPGGITATTNSAADVSMMPAHAAALEAGMNLFAAQFNRPELTNAPIATYGFSGGSGFAAYYAAYNPGRCVAFAHNKGGSIGDYDPVFMEAAEQVPAMLTYGEIDTTNRIDAINAVFTYHRAKGALWTLIPDYGLDHDSQGYGRFLGAAFLDRVIEMRLPRDWVPGGAAPVLSSLAEDSGWLGDNTTWESNSSTIVPFSTSSADLAVKRTMSWMSDQYLAEAWRSVTTHFPPVKLSSPVSALATTRPKQLAYLLAGDSQVMALNATSGLVASVDWKDGDVLVRTETTPFSTTLSAVTGGLHLIHGELLMTNGSSLAGDLAILLVKPPANQTPVILSGPDVSGSPTSGVPVACSVRASDPDGSIEELLTYTWSATGPGTVVFGSGNGSNAGKDIAATFPVNGSYALTVVVADANAATVSSSVNIVVGDIIAPSASFTVSTNSGTVPLSVTFTDTSTGSITNRFWSFGDGATTNTTATSIAHTYTSVGTNTVQLIVSGPLGASTNTQGAAVIVTPPAAPVANFSASPTSGSAPLPVTFTDTSTGTITNRTWSFGDGGISNTTATSVLHTYTSAGTNTVQLIVTGPGGASTNTQVNLISVAAASAGTLLVEEHFDYSASTNLTGNTPVTGGTWGGGGSSVVLGSGLSSPGGFAEASGNEIKIGTSGAAQTNRFTTVNSGTVYMSYLVQFNTLKNGASEWGGLSLNGAAEYAQLQYTNTTGNSYYQLGLGGRSTAFTTNWLPDQFTVGQTQLVVVAYTFVAGAANDIMSLWINPDSSTFGAGSAPAADLTAIASSEAGSLNTIDIKNSSTLPANTILDEMRVGTNWASVVPAASSAPGNDTDSDGIPNDWETQYFGGATNANPSAPAANGMNTVMEAYVAGLNPTNAQSIFALSNTLIAAQAKLQWSAASGRVYSVYWTTNLFNNFQPLETNILWPQSSWTDLVHGAEIKNFYQIKVRLSP